MWNEQSLTHKEELTPQLSIIHYNHLPVSEPLEGRGFGAQSLSCSKTCDPDWLLSLRMTGGRWGYMAW